jgi:mRNA interferase YafQ
MREIKQTGAFKRDIKRESNGPHVAVLNAVLPNILKLLADDQPLPAKLQDHALKGQWINHRECHIKPNLLLIYIKPDDTTLTLVRLGSHSILLLCQ